ncbi:MAG: hypothetical protein IPH18_12530 [Chitinophagaceae bacterium]|nr:hypothetical protein [Chitinophagaceae bacterium]
MLRRSIYKDSTAKQQRSIVNLRGHAVTGTNILKLLSGAGKIDLAVIGFGEYPLLGLVEHFDDYKEQQIGGICWLENGKLHINPPVSLSQDDFNGLCQINYSVIPYKNYWEFNSGIYDAEDLRIMKNANTHQTVRINTSSHCNIGCTFCSATNFFSHCQTKQKNTKSGYRFHYQHH